MASRLPYAFVQLRALDPGQADRILKGGGLLIDLRGIDDYLARHIQGSIPLLYEAGPGLSSRARDLLPLDARLVLVEDETSPLEDAAASFRGKGFDVAGFLPGGVDADPGPFRYAGTPVMKVEDAEPELTLLDVADPGTRAPERKVFIPAELLWERHGELGDVRRIGVLAGWGVRAASAVGILERLGFGDIFFVRTRPAGDRPPQADPLVFRAGGPP